MQNGSLVGIHILHARFCHVWCEVSVGKSIKSPLLVGYAVQKHYVNSDALLHCAISVSVFPKDFFVVVNLAILEQLRSCKRPLQVEQF